MTERETPRTTEEITAKVAAELNLGPEDPVFRHLHPVMFCGVAEGKLLLKGNRGNPTLVINQYTTNPAKREVRASEVGEQGLNFTIGSYGSYKSENRRVGVSFKMIDQAKGLKIYDDRGSQVSAVFFSLPDDEFFKVDYKDGDLADIAIGIKIHQLMAAIPGVEEPKYLRFLENDVGCMVYMYLQRDGIEPDPKIEISFEKDENSFRMKSSFDTAVDFTDDEKEAAQQMAIYRLMLENTTFDTITLENGEKVKRKTLLIEVIQGAEYDQLVDLKS